MNLITTNREIKKELINPGYSVIPASEIYFSPILDQDRESFVQDWGNLQLDEHMKDGSWGKGLKPIQFCTICGKEFLPPDSHVHKTCSPECLSELGRVNAMKRWQSASGTRKRARRLTAATSILRS